MSDSIADKLNNYKKVVLEHRSNSQDLLFDTDDLLAYFGDLNDPEFLKVLRKQISTIVHWFDKEGDPELSALFLLNIPTTGLFVVQDPSTSTPSKKSREPTSTRNRASSIIHGIKINQNSNNCDLFLILK